MIQAIISGIFKLVMMLFTTITTPIFNVIFALFPNLSTYFTYINNFLSLSFTYIGASAGLFLVTTTMFIAIFDYFIIKYSIYLSLKAYKLFVNVYNKFKV